MTEKHKQNIVRLLLRWHDNLPDTSDDLYAAEWSNTYERIRGLCETLCASEEVSEDKEYAMQCSLCNVVSDTKPYGIRVRLESICNSYIKNDADLYLDR